jgi:hypothetical protein
VVIVAKFAEGAWITLVAIPALMLTMYGVRSHYAKISREIDIDTPIEGHIPDPPILVITMQRWTRINKQALEAAMGLSREIKVVHVAEEDRSNDFCDRWEEYIARPAREANLPVPELVQLHSPYRVVVTPIVDYVRHLARENADRRVVTVIPELIQRRWFQWLLHTQRAEILKARLLMEGSDHISVLNIPWYQNS